MNQLYLIDIYGVFGRHEYFVGLEDGESDFNTCSFRVPQFQFNTSKTENPELRFFHLPISRNIVRALYPISKMGLETLLTNQTSFAYWQEWEIFLRFNPTQFLTSPKNRTRKLIPFFLSDQFLKNQSGDPLIESKQYLKEVPAEEFF